MDETSGFMKFNLSSKVIKAIDDMGFEEPSPIQTLTIPSIIDGKDIIGQSQTGTGKTAAFGIPIIEKIDAKKKAIQSVILCPTRELAIQISEEFLTIGKYVENLSIVPIYGGQSIERQIKALKKGAQIIIGTPGRVMDHIERKTISFDEVNSIVLDEADEMLDMGFIDDIVFILERIPQTRQTILFSATMPDPIVRITKKFQRNPEFLKVAHKELTVPKIEQSFIEVQRAKMKLDITTRLLDLYDPKLTLIFCNTKKMVDELVSHLQARGYFADGLHGDLKQAQRNAVMSKFKSEIVDILIATDVAARGIDIDNIELVINYDIPQDEEYYVHRIGRTGRAGRSGKAVTLATGREIRKIREIENYIKVRIKKMAAPTVEDVEELKTSRFAEEIKATIAEGHLTKYINIVENMTDDEVSSLDVAAALLKMSLRDNKPEEQIKNEDENSFKYERDDYDDYDNRRGGRGKRGFKNNRDSGMARLFLNVGKKQNISPKNIVGAFANESGIEGSLIGTIDIFDDFTFVEVPKEYADEVIEAMKNNFINGKKVNIEVAKKRK